MKRSSLWLLHLNIFMAGKTEIIDGRVQQRGFLGAMRHMAFRAFTFGDRVMGIGRSRADGIMAFLTEFVLSLYKQGRIRAAVRRMTGTAFAVRNRSVLYGKAGVIQIVAIEANLVAGRVGDNSLFIKSMARLTIHFRNRAVNRREQKRRFRGAVWIMAKDTIGCCDIGTGMFFPQG